MSICTTIRSIGWLIGLILLFSWNVQAESNPPRHSVQFMESFNGSTPAIDPPISLTAAVGTLFRYPVSIPMLLSRAG